MTNLKNVMLKVLKKLLFSLFLATLLLTILFQKTKTQIIGIDQGSTSQLIKNLQDQVDQQKTQLDTIKTTLGTIESRIKEQEESLKKVDTQQEFKKQLEEDKQKLKNAWVSYLSIEPEVTEDQDIVDKFNQAKDATEKHEQEFISKLEIKKEVPTETIQPKPAPGVVKKEETKPEEIKQEVAPEVMPAAETEVKTEEKVILEPAPQEPKPSEEVPAIVPQPEPFMEVQTISKQIVPQEEPQKPSITEPTEQTSGIITPFPVEKEQITSEPEKLPDEQKPENVPQVPGQISPEQS